MKLISLGQQAFVLRVRKTTKLPRTGQLHQVGPDFDSWIQLVKHDVKSDSFFFVVTESLICLSMLPHKSVFAHSCGEDVLTFPRL